MKNVYCLLIFLFCLNFSFSQKVEFQTLLKDNISIRALQIYDGKVWYSGSDSKFGYVNLKDSADKKQMKLSDQKLEFRTLAQDPNYFYAVNILSPAYFFKIDKKSLKSKIIYSDTLKSAFYDALHFVKDDKIALAFSDPDKNQNLKLTVLMPDKNIYNDFRIGKGDHNFKLKEGESAFAASNTNISAVGNTVWIATGGKYSRILKINLRSFDLEAFQTPFIQGTASTGIYSIDLYDKNFGIAVGGDYTKQAENINNIATTNDGGKTWQIQASGKNGGYKTCVKFRPKSKGKDIIAVGDQNIEFSSDYGKTWKTISEEKGLYVCAWIDQNSVVFAGKNRIVKMKLK